MILENVNLSNRKLLTGDYVMSLIEEIKRLLKQVWYFIKKIALKVLNFFKNIIGFFKTPNRLKDLKNNENIIAIAIRDNLENNNYNTVSLAMFDTKSNELYDYQENSLHITAESLDAETISQFGHKDMLVIKA